MTALEVRVLRALDGAGRRFSSVEDIALASGEGELDVEVALAALHMRDLVDVAGPAPDEAWACSRDGRRALDAIDGCAAGVRGPLAPAGYHEASRLPAGGTPRRGA